MSLCNSLLLTYLYIYTDRYNLLHPQCLSPSKGVRLAMRSDKQEFGYLKPNMYGNQTIQRKSMLSQHTQLKTGTQTLGFVTNSQSFTPFVKIVAE